MKTKGRIIALLTIFAVGLCSYVTCSYAATINVANYGDGKCSLANVQSAYNSASTGDTIMFPLNCAATWSSALTIGKALTINGNGTTLAASGSLSSGFFNITGFAASSSMRITGFVFQLANWTTARAIYVHGMTGGVGVGQIRIDNNTFYYGREVISFYHGKGLIDNNHFYNAVIAITLDSGSRDNADESWISMAAGTADALFIEGNHFITDSNYTLGYTQEQIGSENGGKLVIRYNEFDADKLADGQIYTPIMTHGSADGGCGAPAIGHWQYDSLTDRCRRRGQSVVEIYNNIAHGKRIDFFITVRGSANLIYNNAITGTVQYNPRIYLWEEEYSSDNWLVKRTAWPAEDQVHNTFIWNNTYRGHDFNDGVYGYVEASPNASAGLLKDRDYFLHAPQATKGKATFTGANGASGSYPTDGVKYPTRGTLVFSAEGPNAYYPYTPYTYPHPLNVSDSAPVTMPSPPRNLMIGP